MIVAETIIAEASEINWPVARTVEVLRRIPVRALKRITAWGGVKFRSSGAVESVACVPKARHDVANIIKAGVQCCGDNR